MPTIVNDLVLDLSAIGLEMLPQVGGKNASLGEMLRELGSAGVRVPDGFALTSEAFRTHLGEAHLVERIALRLSSIDVHDLAALSAAGSEIRAWIQAAPLPAEVARQARAAYEELSKRHGVAAIDVAVRSSATAEDLPAASFAGQQETFLDVCGWDDLDRAIRGCMASLYTDRAIVYRAEHRIEHGAVALSVGVQRMVRSDLASAGVCFTLDTETGFRDVVLITGSWGLGETVVQGRVNPDEYWVHKPTLLRGFKPVLRREMGSKAIKLVYGDPKSRALREVRASPEERHSFVLDEEEVLLLARWSIAIEEHYSKKYGHPTPMDIEWAKDGRTGEIFIVQARPETVHSQVAAPRIELFKLKGKGQVLVRGKSVGSRIGTGNVHIIHSRAELSSFRTGEVLVTQMTDPDWEPILRRASAVVTDQGGRTCHAAILSRELNLPCVVGTGTASTSLTDGVEVTVSCAEGDEGRVYAGRVPFERMEIDPAELPTPRVPLMVNLADPDHAFRISRLPCAGVGLLRIEFLVSNWIGVHPMALVHPERVADAAVRAEIERRASRSASLEEFFVERMASGLAIIGAAFHPRPVIVRFSDFKTNEYARLLGGEAFEPKEANPMIGFRGASRYYDDRYREGFALECRAVKRVRERMGLENVKVMIPFCRTLSEGRAVLAEMEKNGLRRGENGLEVWVMCEIPNNVILAEEFSQLFDGFSIGSNDLTQLALGIDRDSQILSHLFDERDPGVMRLIASVVERAHRKGRRVGICGQAPSDHPEFAEWLASIGIDSISLTPDSLAAVARRLAVVKV
jgi:pyruvate, water dikinase